MRIELLEENKSTPLAIVGELLLNNITTDSLDLEEQLSVDLKPYQGKRVNLRLQIIPNYLSVLSKQITRIDVKDFSGGGIENQKIEQLASSNMTLVPEKFTLYQNYPNPFNPVTTISFDLPEECEVTLKIFNTLGELIKILVSDRLSAGTYHYLWNSQSLASGVYLYRLKAGNFIETRKMVLMR